MFCVKTTWLTTDFSNTATCPKVSEFGFFELWPISSERDLLVASYYVTVTRKIALVSLSFG